MGTSICFMYEVQLLSQDPHGYSPAGIVRALQSVGVSDMQQVSAVSQEDDLISGKAECFFRVRTREIVDKLIALPSFKAVSVSGTEYDMSFCKPKACMADRERLRYNLMELKRLETEMTAMGARQHLFSGMPSSFPVFLPIAFLTLGQQASSVSCSRRISSRRTTRTWRGSTR